jgi:hypothetical protein
VESPAWYMKYTKTGMRAMRAQVTTFAGFTEFQSTEQLCRC